MKGSKLVPLPTTADPGQIRTRALEVLRRCNGAVTVADLVVATGIPARDLEDALSELFREYEGFQQVTESGEVLYALAFLREREVVRRDGASRRRVELHDITRPFLRGVTRRLPPVLMGTYFATFLTIPFPPALILLAVLLSSWNNMDLLDYYGSYGHARWGNDGGPLLPPVSFHEYLFGNDGIREEARHTELLTVLSFVRSHRGLLSHEEIMELTGYSPRDAQDYLDELLVAFSGDPAVSENGSIAYRFPELMKTTAATRAIELSGVHGARWKRRSVSDRTRSRKESRLISLVNYANFLFAVYYGSLSLKYMLGGIPPDGPASQLHSGITLFFGAIYNFMTGAHVAHTLPAIFLILGVIPFGVATTFFALHWRADRRKAAFERESAERRLRKQVYSEVFSHPQFVDAGQISVNGMRHSRGGTRRAVVRILDELAAAFHAEIEDTGSGHYIYRFPEIQSDAYDVERMRSSIDPEQLGVGKVLFDSTAGSRALRGDE